MNLRLCGHLFSVSAGEVKQDGTQTARAAACQKQEADCGGVCSTLADDAHCGSCDKACPQGQHCGNGSCFSCAPNAPSYCPYPNGGGSCTDLVTDNVNCGSCGHPCALLPTYRYWGGSYAAQTTR